MPTLHAPMALGALANGDLEAADHRRLDRQLLLILGGDPHGPDRAVALRALRGERRRIRLIDVGRRTAMPVPPMGSAGFAAAAPWVCHAGAPRERGGLPRDRAARRLELLFQFLVFAAQPLAFRFRAAQILAQPVDLSPLLVNDLLRGSRRRRLVALRHTTVMPDRRSKYKRQIRTRLH
jgi:hypothetical protein